MTAPDPKTYTRADVIKWLDKYTVQKGEGYLSRVVGSTVLTDSITGKVQGTRHLPYMTTAHFTPAGLSSTCTCPMRGSCKHVAALLLRTLKERGTPEDISSNILAWITEIRHLSQAVEKKRKTNTANQAKLYYLLEWDDKKGASVTTCKGTRPDKLQSWTLTERALRQPPEFVSEEDMPILRTLLMEEAQPVLIEKLLATGRLITGNPPLILAPGPSRPARVIWKQQASGKQSPGLVTQPPATILMLDKPWYLDRHEALVGPLQLDTPPDILQKLLALPPLSRKEAALVAATLKEIAPQTPLPQVYDSATVRAIDSPPQGELRLDTLEAPGMRPWRDHPVHNRGRHFFDYAEATLCYAEACLSFDDPREFVTLPTGELVHLKRQKAAEARLLASLKKANLLPVPANVLYLSEQRPARIYSLGAEQDWPDFMQDGIAALEAQHWRVSYKPDFRHHYLEVEGWDAEISEAGGEAGSGWLDLDMGVLVEGERLPLAPMLSNLLHRESRWLNAALLNDIPDNESVALFTEDSRRLRVPAERIKPIARLLIDLFDGYHEGSLRISRFDAARLEMLQDTSRWQFRGPDAVLQLAERLRSSQGVQDIAPPRGLKLALRDYQRTGLAWLQYLREHELSGILADDMGLGKTAQALAHLLIEKEAGRLTHPALIVLPTSLIFNWKNEAARFAPDLKVLSLHGQDRKTRFDAIPAHDVVLTTYPLLWRDGKQLRAHEYHMLVLDEAQIVKNAHSKGAAEVRQINATHRLCLTGTPLENHLGELWTQFDFLLPGFLGDAKSFTRLWRNPIEKHGNALRRDLLARRIRPFILRRKKDEVATELPPKTTIIRTVELVGSQRDLYETVRAAMDEKVRAEIAQRGFMRSQIIILDALLKLRQVCCDPRLVKSTAARKVKEQAKLDLLMDMLPEMVEEGRRILVFSQFTAMLDLIQAELENINLKFLRLTGETKDRETPITAFQAGLAPIFLISLKAGGVGLNLTAADTVIHYDPWWNPAVENQATDRAHRLGQDKPVFVYKLIAAGSIEEKILALQEQKAALAAGILSDEHKGDVKFGEADIAALFEPLPR
jgi:superfamily II DNA or RNA helicase